MQHKSEQFSHFRGKQLPCRQSREVRAFCVRLGPIVLFVQKHFHVKNKMANDRTPPFRCDLVVVQDFERNTNVAHFLFDCSSPVIVLVDVVQPIGMLHIGRQFCTMFVSNLLSLVLTADVTTSRLRNVQGTHQAKAGSPDVPRAVAYSASWTG